VEQGHFLGASPASGGRGASTATCAGNEARSWLEKATLTISGAAGPMVLDAIMKLKNRHVPFRGIVAWSNADTSDFSADVSREMASEVDASLIDGYMHRLDIRVVAIVLMADRNFAPGVFIIE
jgi:hypothetical protein